MELLLGTKGTFASIETGKAIVATLLQGEFHPMEGAGHLPWLESPAACGQLVENFLVRHSARKAGH